MEDSGIESDHKSTSNSSFDSQSNMSKNSPEESRDKDTKISRRALELQKKIEKQRERNRRKQVLEEQPKRSFLLPRSRLNIPSKHESGIQAHDQQPLVAIMSDDSEEDEFAVPKLSKDAQKEIAEQLLKDGYQIDIELDEEDLDLIPPRPLNQRCSCCPSVILPTEKCAIQ